MALFPKIQSPCPYPGKLDDIVTAGRCSLCDKVVHDLTSMSDDQRRHLVESNSGNLCVRYTVLRPALAAMALGAMSVGTTVATAAERPIATTRHSGGKVAKTTRARAHRVPVIPVIFAGAPLPITSAEPEKPARGRADPPNVTWTQEIPAPNGD